MHFIRMLYYNRFLKFGFFLLMFFILIYPSTALQYGAGTYGKGAYGSGYTTPSQGGPSGGGGVIFADFILDKDIFHVLIKQGETQRETLTIKNTGNLKLDLKIETQDLSKFILFSEESFSLSPKESKIINLDFFAKEEEIPEVYTGKIIVKTEDIARIINVIIEVKERKPLFDLKVDLFKKEIPLNKNLKSKISILNLGDLKNIDILLYYSIKDFDGNIYEYKEESLKIDKNLELIRTLKVPDDVALGDYIFYVKITYKNVIATSSETFKIIYKDNSIIIGLVLLLIVAGMVFLFKKLKIKIYLLKKQKKKRKKKRRTRKTKKKLKRKKSKRRKTKKKSK